MKRWSCSSASLISSLALSASVRATTSVGTPITSAASRAAVSVRMNWLVGTSTLPPTRAAIIMTMEPVFAATFAVLLGGEDPTLRMLVGGGMVLAAMLLVELAPRRKIEAEVTHLAV